MRITFLGTGTSQGVPVIGCSCEVCLSLDFRDKRLRSSIHIQEQQNSFVIDTGPDFRNQLLRERIHTLDAVIFTHQHKDHTAGLDDVRPFNFRQNQFMPIYGRDSVIEQLKKEFTYAFSDSKYPGVPMLTPHIIQNTAFEIKGTTFTPIEVMHYRLPVFGYRIHDFTYITDAKTISDEEKRKIAGSKVIVVNALQKGAHISHFTLSEAVAFLEEMQPEKAYLTHLSHTMGKHKEVERQLPEFIKLAFDGLTLDV